MRALILSSFVVIGAIAAPDLSAAEGFQCHPAGLQQDMNACAADEYKAADHALNDRYRRVMATLPSARKTALRTEQRQWMKERDPRCKEEVKASEGGSIWPLEYLSCRTAATKARTAELDRWKVR